MALSDVNPYAWYENWQNAAPSLGWQYRDEGDYSRWVQPGGGAEGANAYLSFDDNNQPIGIDTQKAYRGDLAKQGYVPYSSMDELQYIANVAKDAYGRRFNGDVNTFINYGFGPGSEIVQDPVHGVLVKAGNPQMALEPAAVQYPQQNNDGFLDSLFEYFGNNPLLAAQLVAGPGFGLSSLLNGTQAPAPVEDAVYSANPGWVSGESLASGGTETLGGGLGSIASELSSVYTPAPYQGEIPAAPPPPAVPDTTPAPWAKSGGWPTNPDPEAAAEQPYAPPPRAFSGNTISTNPDPEMLAAEAAYNKLAQERLAQGWTFNADGDLTPPGATTYPLPVEPPVSQVELPPQGEFNWPTVPYEPPPFQGEVPNPPAPDGTPYQVPYTPAPYQGEIPPPPTPEGVPTGNYAPVVDATYSPSGNPTTPGVGSAIDKAVQIAKDNPLATGLGGLALVGGLGGGTQTETPAAPAPAPAPAPDAPWTPPPQYNVSLTKPKAWNPAAPAPGANIGVTLPEYGPRTPIAAAQLQTPTGLGGLVDRYRLNVSAPFAYPMRDGGSVLDLGVKYRVPTYYGG